MQNANVARLLKAGFLFLILLSIFVIALTVNTFKENRFIGGGVPESTTISVSGEGEVFAIPDIAEFTFTVEERADTVALAQEAAAEKNNAIIAFLKNEGVDEDDIKTLNYSARPDYEWQQETVVCVRIPCPQPSGHQILIGYVVQQSVQVKVRDTERAGDLLSGVGEREVSYVGGLTFTIDDEEELQRDARQEAIDDARTKAKELADDLGVHLIRVVGFSESGFPTPYYARGGFDTALAVEEVGAPTPDLPPGENRIVSNVTITYEIR